MRVVLLRLCKTSGVRDAWQRLSGTALRGDTATPPLGHEEACIRVWLGSSFRNGSRQSLHEIFIESNMVLKENGNIHLKQIQKEQSIFETECPPTTSRSSTRNGQLSEQLKQCLVRLGIVSRNELRYSDFEVRTTLNRVPVLRYVLEMSSLNLVKSVNERA